MSNLAIEGIVLTDPEFGSTPKGAEFLRWSMRNDKHRLFNCVIWLKKFKGDSTKIKKGETLLVRGFWGKPKKDLFDKIEEFIVQWLGIQGEEKEEEKRRRLLRWMGGEEKIKDYWRTKQEQCEREGIIRYVINGVGKYFKKEDCVMVSERWIPKVEFVMDILGPETTSRLFYEWSEKFWKVKNLADFPKEEYETFLLSLVTMALGDVQGQNDRT